jgi:hypothetical protein
MYALESWGAGLGIDSSHTQEAIDLARADGVGERTASPIDTFAGRGSGFSNPWASDLLGPAGSLRSSIVDLVLVAESL